MLMISFYQKTRTKNVQVSFHYFKLQPLNSDAAQIMLILKPVSQQETSQISLNDSVPNNVLY